MTTCANHTETPATAYCRTCGKPLCDSCKRDVRGVIYCEECLAAMVASANPSAIPAAAASATSTTGASYAVPPIPPAAEVSSPPSVGLATFLGFIPGVGAMYNGQFAKAFVHILIFVVLANLADAAEAFGLFVAGFVFYMVLDANRTAKARLLGQPLPDLIGINSLVGEQQASGARAATRNFWRGAGQKIDAAGQVQDKPPIVAFVLIGLGVLFLLQNIGVFPLRWINIFGWPLALIAVGLWMGIRRWNCADEAGAQ
jgi:hypothetical protein